MLRTAIAAAPAVQDPVPISASAPRWRRIAFIFLLGGVLGCLPARGHTAGLDCPEMGPGAPHRSQCIKVSFLRYVTYAMLRHPQRTGGKHVPYGKQTSARGGRPCGDTYSPIGMVAGCTPSPGARHDRTH